MVSVARAVGASSAATRGSAGTGQEALAPVVHTAGALREARSRRTFAQNMHEFPCISACRRQALIAMIFQVFCSELCQSAL